MQHIVWIFGIMINVDEWAFHFHVSMTKESQDELLKKGNKNLSFLSFKSERFVADTGDRFNTFLHSRGYSKNFASKA